MAITRKQLDALPARARREALRQLAEPRPSAGPSPAMRIINLPWPPSMNHYWRRVGDKTLISKEGREYRKRVIAKCMFGGQPMMRRLRCWATAFPPDRRKRDLDNLLKPLLDALQHAGMYVDDEQIDDLRIIRGELRLGGGVFVVIEDIMPAKAGKEKDDGC